MFEFRQEKKIFLFSQASSPALKPTQTSMGTGVFFPGVKRPERKDEHSSQSKVEVNRLTPNDPYMGRTAPLTSKRWILCIYSTNIGTEYFKHSLYSPYFSLQNAICFIMLTCLVPVLFTFCIQGVLKLKKIIPAPKG